MKNNNNKQEQQQQQLSRPRQVQQAHTRPKCSQLPFEENCPNQLPVLVCVCVNKYHWKEASILISLCDK